MTQSITRASPPWWHYALKLLPLNALSYVVGVLARLKLSHPKARVLLVRFVEKFKIDLSESALDLSAAQSIEDIFTRALKSGLRPMESEVSSPADGTLSESHAVSHGMAIQAKGLYYSLVELAFGNQYFDPATVKNWMPAWATTIYLAPHNYHRVHAPLKGILTRIIHIPGELWPVAPQYAAFLPRLFSRNERLVFHIETEGGGLLQVCMVGALNVGRISTPFAPGKHTNAHLFRECSDWLEAPREVELGEELGTFMLGSTVVLIFNQALAEKFSLVEIARPIPIKLGQSLIA